jgi:CRISPR/Cas system-associated endonuclease/helicase Cas3
LIEKADLVLAERFHIGPGNLDNLRAALEALEKGKKVIVLENNLEYDFTGGEARACYRRLKEEGAVFITDHSRLLEEAEKHLNPN